MTPQCKSAAVLFYWVIPMMVCFNTHDSLAQSYEKLNKLKGYQVRVFYSTGAEVKGKRMAEQLDKVIVFYDKQIQFKPSVTLLILSPEDWNQYTSFPVYGMPHYDDNKTLIVASEDNDFWKSFIPALDNIPKEFAELIATTYSGNQGDLTMEPFFDLLALHELGHAYHQQGGLTMQRKWMGELFSNIFLHSYIAENEPRLINALTTFPKMVVATTEKPTLRYTTLEELEANYNELGQKYPQNYGWYQCRWHMAAADVYDEGGLTIFTNLWQTLKTSSNILDNQAFASILSKQVHQSVADIQLNWDKNK